METMNRYTNIEPILSAVASGYYAFAKELIQERCRTVPERQARRLAQVVGALIERGGADAAVRLINLFDN